MKTLYTDAIIDDCLRRGTGFTNGKRKVYRLIKSGCAGRELETQLKKAYGTGGWTHATKLDEQINLDHGSSGIRLYSFQSKDERRLTWGEVAQRITRLVEDGEYITHMQDACDSGIYWAMVRAIRNI